MYVCMYVNLKHTKKFGIFGYLLVLMLWLYHNRLSVPFVKTGPSVNSPALAVYGVTDRSILVIGYHIVICHRDNHLTKTYEEYCSTKILRIMVNPL